MKKNARLVVLILFKLLELLVFWPLYLTMAIDPDHSHEAIVGGVLLQIIWLGTLLTLVFKYIIF